MTCKASIIEIRATDIRVELDDGEHKREVRVPREQADIIDHPDAITFFMGNGYQGAIDPSVEGFAELMSKLTSF